jgi:putative FmdB family regulatory protein
MPIYEYHCKACKRDFEILQKISDPPLATCPACGRGVRRLISQTSFSLKGGGWYKDGYASRTPSCSGAPKKTEKSEKAGTKTEMKTETKTEKKASTSKTSGS